MKFNLKLFETVTLEEQHNVIISCLSLLCHVETAHKQRFMTSFYAVETVLYSKPSCGGPAVGIVNFSDGLVRDILLHESSVQFSCGLIDLYSIPDFELYF